MPTVQAPDFLGSPFWAAENRRLVAILRPLLQEVAELGVGIAEEELLQFEVGFDNALANTEAADWARRHTDELLLQFGTTTRKQVNSIIANWFTTPGGLVGEFVEIPGMTLGDLATALERVLGYNKYRARMIARTESTRALSAGRETSRVTAGLPRTLYRAPAHVNCRCGDSEELLADGTWVVIWQTRRDEVVCIRPLETPLGEMQGCRDLHGRVISEGPYFGMPIEEARAIAAERAKGQEQVTTEQAAAELAGALAEYGAWQAGGRSVPVKFDPNQPRDESGRWTSGGSGGVWVDDAIAAYMGGEGEIISSGNVAADVYAVGDAVVKVPKEGWGFMWTEYGGAQEIASQQLDFVPATRYFYSKETGPLLVQKRIDIDPHRQPTAQDLANIREQAIGKGYTPLDLRAGNAVYDTDGRLWVVDIDMWTFPKDVLRQGAVLCRERHAAASAAEVGTKFDVAQPRDEQGRWTTGGVGAVSPHDAAMVALDARGQALLAAEREIVTQGYETAVVVDADGKAVLRKDGGKSEIYFTKDEMARMEGCTFTHNHPSGSSFSEEDISFAIRTGLAEMHAVGPQGGKRYKYTWRPAQKIEGEQWATIRRITSQAGSELYRESCKAVDTGKMTLEEANAQYNHTLWQTVNDRLLAEHGIDVGYSREEW